MRGSKVVTSGWLYALNKGCMSMAQVFPTSGAVTKGIAPLVITREIKPILRRVEDADRLSRLGKGRYQEKCW